VHDVRVPRVSDTREVELIGLRAHGNSDGPEMRLDGHETGFVLSFLFSFLSPFQGLI
jgi:hypothetical protein